MRKSSSLLDNNGNIIRHGASFGEKLPYLMIDGKTEASLAIKDRSAFCFSGQPVQKNQILDDFTSGIVALKGESAVSFLAVFGVCDAHGEYETFLP